MADKKTIMVVEDDVFISSIYETKFVLEGYTVILAINGKEALEKLETQIPDIMLLDLVMPYMDGFDVLEELRANKKWSDIPVILLTNLSQKEDVERGLELGAKDYLIKSHFTPSDVLLKVETLLGGKK